MVHYIFISRPNTLLTKGQELFIDKLNSALKIRGLITRSLGSTDYSNKAPLLGVKQILKESEGVIILGLSQTYVNSCLTPKKNKRENFYLPTPWNNLEGGMAFSLNLPLLIIKEEGIEGGIFDNGVTDKYIHQVNLDLNDTNNKDSEDKNAFIRKYFESEEFLQSINEWFEEVVIYSWRKRKIQENSEKIYL